MKDWSVPIAVSVLDIGMGPKDISTLLPDMKDIPEEFKARNGVGEAKKWVKAVDDIFFSGVKGIKAVPKNKIDTRIAMGHMQAILHSFQPRHEHKTAGVAYLMSLWFEEFKYETVMDHV